MSGLPPITTSIGSLFSQIDTIASELNTLTARSPTYAQFNGTLQTVSRQIAGIQQQLNTFEDQIQLILFLLQAIVDGQASVAKQDQIIAMLQTIQRTLQNVPGIPVQIGVDLGHVETTEQEIPDKPGP